MFGIHDFLMFVASGLLLSITPGQDVLYIVGRGASQGSKAGMVAALGVGTGCLVHITAATLGLSALIATSATVFTVIKIIGAAYLLYMGVSILRSAKPAAVDAYACTITSSTPSTNLVTIWRQGFLCNALNPKVALFFLAFLPQFIDPTSTQTNMAFLTLGVVFSINGTLVCLLYGICAGRLAAKINPAGHLAAWSKRLAGCVFLGLGLRLALSERG
ncbi:LysE family translocator [Desulfovibrio inopinatus]|uniref:LysE family translocator n=1 Tax=Desulfovibrio inopinatus TaxID=102109 RepID=UPI00040B7F68|nr:LysE family translocator [Desulfovibrio inopinatus]